MSLEIQSQPRESLKERIRYGFFNDLLEGYEESCTLISRRASASISSGSNRSPVGKTSAACFQLMITSADPLFGYFHEKVAPVIV